ncbi:chromosome condensation regulator [Bacteroidota bacterium]|nr:chromosome condensation regulator [Bacteroidota bacterium]
MKIALPYVLILVLALTGANTHAQCWRSVQTGANHCIVLKTDGTLWTWGNNSNGQIGNGGNSDILNPYQVGWADDWSKVGTGKSSNHNLAIKNNGTLWAWGDNFYGQLGFDAGVNYATPQQVGTDTDWHKVYCGMFFSIAIKTDSTLWGWGSNEFGQVDESNSSNFILVPTQISADSNWSELSCGDGHCLALNSAGEMYAWGFNLQGTVGNGNSGIGSNATLQHIATEYTWLSVAAGDSHSLAVRSDNTLWSWGTSTSGELGNGVLFSQNSLPAQVGTESDWAKVFSGEYCSFGIKTDGTLWAWGQNAYGELGIGNNENQFSPVQVGTESNWASVQSGRSHTIGLKNDNSAMTWGRNTYGTLGNGTYGGDGTGLNQYSNVPVALLCSPVGGIESLTENSLSVYPNPAHNSINFVMPNGRQAERVEIYNYLGKIVYTSKLYSNSLDIRGLAAGSYLVILSGNENSVQSWFVKE